MAVSRARHVLEGPAPNALRRDLGEEPFDLIEPARAGRGEMQVVARVAHKPPHHLRHFVRPVVVHDDVNVTGRRQLRVERVGGISETLDGDGVDDTGR